MQFLDDLACNCLVFEPLKAICSGLLITSEQKSRGSRISGVREALVGQSDRFGSSLLSPEQCAVVLRRYTVFYWAVCVQEISARVAVGGCIGSENTEIQFDSCCDSVGCRCGVLCFCSDWLPENSAPTR